jgi:hypothetical protein
LIKVIGASSMIGLDVIFDVENERVGFVEAHCSKHLRNS